METSERRDQFEIVGVHEVDGGASLVVLEGQPEHRLGSGVSPQHLTFGPQHENEVGEFVKETRQWRVRGGHPGALHPPMRFPV